MSLEQEKISQAPEESKGKWREVVIVGLNALQEVVKKKLVGMYLLKDVEDPKELGTYLLRAWEKLTPNALKRFGSRNIDRIIISDGPGELTAQEFEEALEEENQWTSGKVVKLPAKVHYGQLKTALQEKFTSIIWIVKKDLPQIKKLFEGKIEETIKHKKIFFEIPQEIKGLFKEVIDIISVESRLIYLGLLYLLKSKNEEGYNHAVDVSVRSVLVGRYAQDSNPALAEKYGLGGDNEEELKERLKQLILSAFFVNIGDLESADYLKERRWTDEEREANRTRREKYRKQILSSLDGGDDLGEAAPFSKIIEMADFFCALEEKRSHRPAYSPLAAMKIKIDRFLQGEFDSELFHLFYQFELISRTTFFPKNMKFQLSNEEKIGVLKESNNKVIHAIVLEPRGLMGAKCCFVEEIFKGRKKKPEEILILNESGLALVRELDFRELLTGGNERLMKIAQPYISKDFSQNEITKEEGWKSEAA